MYPVALVDASARLSHRIDVVVVGLQDGGGYGPSQSLVVLHPDSCAGLQGLVGLAAPVIPGMAPCLGGVFSVV